MGNDGTMIAPPPPRPAAPPGRPAPQRPDAVPETYFKVPASGQVTLRAGEAIALDDPDLVLHLVSGVVEVFAIQRRDGSQVGPRMFMCSAEEDDLVFGMRPSDPENEIRLIGLAVVESTCDRYQVSAIGRQPLSVPQANALAAPMDTWIERLSERLVHYIQPRSNPKRWVLPGEEINVASAERASAHKGVVWVQLLDGSGRYVDICDIPSADGKTMIPLSQSTWLRETGVTRLRGYDTPVMLRIPGWMERLAFFHDTVIKALTFAFRNASVAEKSRLSKRAGRTAEDTERTLIKFVSLLDPHSPYRPAVTADSALFECCAIVGKAMGLAMNPPPTARRNRMDDPPLTVDDIARYSQVRARTVALRGAWWTEDNGPLVGFFKEDYRPVALTVGKDGAYVLREPVSGDTRKVTEEVAMALSAVAHTFYPSLPDRKLSAKDLIAFGMTTAKKDIAIVLLTGALGGLLGTAIPIATGYIFDTVIPGHQRHQLLEVGLALLVAAMASAIFKITGDIALLRMEGKIAGILQAAIIDRLLRLPNSFFANYSSGDLANRTLMIEQIRKTLSNVVLSSVLAGVFSLFSFALLFVYNGWAALVATTILIFLVVVTLIAGFSQLSAIMEGEAITGNINSIVLELITGITKLRLAGAEERAFNQWGANFGEMRARMVKSRKVGNTFQVFTAGYEIISLAAIFAVIAIMSGKDLSTGGFLAFIGAFTTFLASIYQLARATVQVITTKPLYERAAPLLTTLPENTGTKADPGQLTGEFEVSQASFRYPGGVRVLNGLSIAAKPGSFIAVVGPSGSGKSTLMKLLLGFEKPETGAVLLDGRDLRGLDLQLVRRQIGVVLQNGKLMPGTIFENIKGATHATVDDAWEAAQMVGLDVDIKAMPMGMHTVLTEGGSALSGGQVQRILLARAVVGKPRLLLLDEATSALDNRTQAVVTESLDRLSVTRIVIAHRLTTIMRADVIFVVKEGRVVEEGNYLQLMAKKGTFYELAERQQL